MSLWQTQSWQDMLIASGQAQEYFMIERDIQQIEGKEYWPVFVEKRRVSMWEYGLFVTWLEWELDPDVTDSLQGLCVEENCLFIQVETIDYTWASSLLAGENWERCLEREWAEWKGYWKYYKKFIPPYTALIDLTQSEEEILAGMKPKGRYNIKLARKKWVLVEQVDTHIWNITKFHKLMGETTSRDSFAGNTLEYYKIFLESLGNSQMFFAYHEQEVIAAGIFVVEWDVMTYYYGASSSNKRNVMAPYLLQWSAIEHAIKRWCKLYDFLGVAGDNETNSSLSGVTNFKMKLSPKKTLVSSSYIYVNKKLKYQVIKLLRKLKK